jgi:hypothetical protein
MFQMETPSPNLWDLTHWARTAGSGAALLLPQSWPWVGARVASPQRSILRPGEESVAEPDAAVQHRTNHLLFKPDNLTCYQHRLSRQKLRQAEAIEIVRLKREQGAQTLAFSSRPFVLCGLPVRRLPPDQLLYERRNGRFVLQITGHPEFGVPSAKIAYCLSSWPLSLCSRKVTSCGFELPLRCWKALACTPAARNTAG